MRRGKTIEEIYQKKSQLEHILLRPDTYVGSTEHQQQDLWVFDEKKKEIVNRRINFVPALYKIFDEILVNAADNLMRDKSMDRIEVVIDKKANSISVMNNGRGIPVQIHKEHQCYVPELIFGHLLTSDNYDDNEKKVTGGRNGYGAKLTNVFSTHFRLETSDSNAKKRFTQNYENNMTTKHPPEIVDATGEDFTRVTFSPDLKKFGMKRLDDDITSLMMKRVYDIAGSSDARCKVILNGKKLPITSFQDYIDLYLKTEEQDMPVPCIHEKVNNRWEVAISVTDGNFQQVSFVNSISTVKGGTHVAHVTDQLIDVILRTVKSKNRGGIDIKPAMVRNHLWVFVNCLIENPAFDSQTKETLTTKSAKFGSACELSDKTVKQVLKSGVVEMILDWVKAKEKVDISRSLRAGNANAKRVMINKLEDANWAGGKQSSECTLILTEGDSAKALAVAGLGVVGRDRYGVFPLKGKVLNVREASFKQVTGNAEIQNLLKILGMDIKREYDSTHELRYGSVMIMTDQDHDGSHIKGLLINMVHHWWPSLLGLGFLKEFVTPIVKVWKEGKKAGDRLHERPFFTLVEYEKWKEKNENGKGWKAKYYKGLGTSTSNEAKEYFREINRHEIGFKWGGETDGEAIDLAFNKKRADDRKEWINGYQEGTFVDHSVKKLSYSDFVNKELVQFAKYDVMRSIASVVDGLKPGQRKVIFSAFKKKLKNDIKVAQFVGFISEHSAYHHGEMSLENTIVNLAQDFVGSNNINLLVPSGQFGTRLQGGSDHAAARYIYTRLSTVTRLIFHPDDDHVLKYLDEEGQRIEPEWYCPILPIALVNGSKGIGTGWSTDVPNFNPRDIIMNIRMMLRGLPMQEMLPWYRGFKGSILPSEEVKDKFDVLGQISKTDGQTLEITELPIRTWTQNYKEYLEGELSEHNIEDLREYHTEKSVHFTVKVNKEKMQKAENNGLHKSFKLKGSIATTNMMLFNAEGKITKYGSALEILDEFCSLRRKMYVRRKAYLVGKLMREKEILSNKARFILMVVKGELELRKRKKVELLEELRRLGFKGMSELNKLVRSSLDEQPAEVAADVDSAATEDAQGTERSDYDYLLGMPLWSLTFEKIEEIKKQLEIKKAELKELQETTEEQMWDRDLEALSVALDELDAKAAEEDSKASILASGRSRGRKRAGESEPPPSAKLKTAGAPVVKSKLGNVKDLTRPIINCEDAIEKRLIALREAQSRPKEEPEGEQPSGGPQAPTSRPEDASVVVDPPATCPAVARAGSTVRTSDTPTSASGTEDTSAKAEDGGSAGTPSISVGCRVRILEGEHKGMECKMIAIAGRGWFTVQLSDDVQIKLRRSQFEVLGQAVSPGSASKQKEEPAKQPDASPSVSSPASSPPPAGSPPGVSQPTPAAPPPSPAPAPAPAPATQQSHSGSEAIMASREKLVELLGKMLDTKGAAMAAELERRVAAAQPLEVRGVKLDVSMQVEALKKYKEAQQGTVRSDSGSKHARPPEPDGSSSSLARGPDPKVVDLDGGDAALKSRKQNSGMPSILDALLPPAPNPVGSVPSVPTPLSARKEPDDVLIEDDAEDAGSKTSPQKKRRKRVADSESGDGDILMQR